MTFQEIHKDSKKLFCRNNLTYCQTIKRLEKYFASDEVLNIIIRADNATSWTDGNIAVICTDKTSEKKYTIVAPATYMELIQP